MKKRHGGLFQKELKILFGERALKEAQAVQCNVDCVTARPGALIRIRGSLQLSDGMHFSYRDRVSPLIID